MHNQGVDQMLKSGNNGSRMQTPQDAIYIRPQWELIASSHKSYHIFASLLQLLDPAKEGFLLRSTEEHIQVTTNHPDDSDLFPNGYCN